MKIRGRDVVAQYQKVLDMKDYSGGGYRVNWDQFIAALQTLKDAGVDSVWVTEDFVLPGVKNPNDAEELISWWFQDDASESERQRSAKEIRGGDAWRLDDLLVETRKMVEKPIK